jgi:hypothetical protein
MRFKQILETYSKEYARGLKNSLIGKISMYHNTFIKHFYGEKGRLTSLVMVICDAIKYTPRDHVI